MHEWVSPLFMLRMVLDTDGLTQAKDLLTVACHYCSPAMGFGTCMTPSHGFWHNFMLACMKNGALLPTLHAASC